MTMLHATIAPGGSLTLPWRPDFNALAYALAGDGYAGPAGPDRATLTTGQLAVFGHGDVVTLAAAATELDVLVLGGRPIREPVAWGGPFVMNTKAEVLQAFEDFQRGRLGTVPAQRA
jgi:redox-sensitive bicupin YhaK (pirin superfamily)